MHLLLLACIENKLSTGEDDPTGFETADDPPDFETADTVDTVDTQDTGGTKVDLEECDPRSFAGYALSVREDCEGGSISHPAYELVERWTDNTIGWSLSSPVMVNLTDDNGNGRIDDNDVPDVITAPYTSGIYAMDGADGSRLWSVGSSQIEQSTPAVGDVDYDGFPEVFVQGLYGSKLISGVDGTTLWEGRAPSSIKTYCGAPGIADFEGDGDVEIYFGRLILDGVTGATVGEGSGGQGTSIPGEGPISVAADIDLDGIMELVAGNTVYAPDGSQIWYNRSEPDGFPAVADFDSDPEAEILVSAQGRATLYDTDGTTLWTYSLPSGGYGGPPAVADVDGDSDPEAIIPYQNGISVLTKDGDELWNYTHGAGTLYDGVSAYDFDGDNDWEVVLNTNDGILLFDGPDGTLLDSYAHGGLYACGQEPTMADIDNDGHAEIAFTFGASYGGPGGVGVLADVDGFAAALSVWNQHQYSITNIENDGEVPVSPDMNWEDINNFRAGPPIDYVFDSKNVVGEIRDLCADRCSVGELTVWWSLGNNGSLKITEQLEVSFYAATDTGDTLLGTEVWFEELLPGQMSAAVETTFVGVVAPVYDVWMEIDGGNSSTYSEVSECDETDNEDFWGAIVCL